MIDIDNQIPEFALYDTERKLRKSSEFLTRGKKTIFAFYPGAFTGVCTKEMCAFRDMHGELDKLNAVVVGISVDSPFANKGFADVHSLTFPLLSDFGRETIRKFGVVWKGLGGVEGYESANRAIFVTDDTGKVVYRWIAGNPGEFPDMEAVKKAL